MSYNPILTATGQLLTYTSGDQVRTGTVSVASGGTYAGNVITNINDGNPSTAWSAANAADWDAQVDLGSAKTINGWGVQAGGAGGTMTCNRSSDGSSFTLVDTMALGAGLIQRFFTPVAARYWRLSNHSSTQINGVYSWELYLAGGAALVRIAPGTAGQHLTMVGGIPAWGT